MRNFVYGCIRYPCITNFIHSTYFINSLVKHYSILNTRAASTRLAHTRGLHSALHGEALEHIRNPHSIVLRAAESRRSRPVRGCVESTASPCARCWVLTLSRNAHHVQMSPGADGGLSLRADLKGPVRVRGRHATRDTVPAPPLFADAQYANAGVASPQMAPSSGTTPYSLGAFV